MVMVQLTHQGMKGVTPWRGMFEERRSSYLMAFRFPHIVHGLSLSLDESLAFFPPFIFFLHHTTLLSCSSLPMGPE